MSTPLTTVELYIKYLPFIRKWIRVYSDQYKLDEDELLSESGLLFMRSLPKYDPTKPFLPWFKRRLLGGFLELARKRCRRARLMPVDREVELEDIPDPRLLVVDDPVAMPTPDSRRLAMETLRLARDWFTRDPYHVRAELRRRLANRSKWNRYRFNAAADTIATRIGG